MIFGVGPIPILDTSMLAISAIYLILANFGFDTFTFYLVKNVICQMKNSQGLDKPSFAVHNYNHSVRNNELSCLTGFQQHKFCQNRL